MSEHFEVKYHENVNFHFLHKANFNMLLPCTVLLYMGHGYLPSKLHLESL